MVVLADIGGTKTRVAVSIDKITILGEETFDTPDNSKAGLERIRIAIQKLSNGTPIDMAILAIAGVCSPDHTTIVQSPHLPKWVNSFSVSDAVLCLGTPVYLENDAALGALGEATEGAGKDYSIMAYVTIGTGVGGARIVNKIIDPTYFGFEIGQQLVPFEGNATLLENIISGKALEKRYGMPSKNIKDEKTWNEVARIFADGLYNTIVHWSPQCVVLGGSVMKDIPLQVVAEQLIERMHIFPELPLLKHGELGDLCGIYGGMALARALSSSKRT